ncbi:hypothetical protein M885DRAFT_20141 [Pelagophyceae sp. CCMP2097]|nr:hypothetical protein M885DRAFT_20141 [Pelagophyceae sp. CCMP2097]
MKIDKGRPGMIDDNVRRARRRLAQARHGPSVRMLAFASLPQETAALTDALVRVAPAGAGARGRSERRGRAARRVPRLRRRGELADVVLRRAGRRGGDAQGRAPVGVRAAVARGVSRRVPRPRRRGITRDARRQLRRRPARAAAPPRGHVR